MVRVCFLAPMGAMSFVEVDDNPMAWHDLLGGYMELFALPMTLPHGLVGLADEDGYRKDLPMNAYAALLKQAIVGPVIIARSEPPEFVDLTERDVIALEEWFGHSVIVVIGQ